MLLKNFTPVLGILWVNQFLDYIPKIPAKWLLEFCPILKLSAPPPVVLSLSI
jgi:hypothetical protein